MKFMRTVWFSGPRPDPGRRFVLVLALVLGTTWALPATDPTPAVDPAPTPTPTPAARTRPDYDAFRLITERNIFNASRSGRRTETPRETRRPARVEAFGLVGTMSYAQGTFAFFDGSGSEYRKALQAGGTVADFQVLEILPNAVKLLGGTNATELRIGMQMRREEAGEWQVAEPEESFAGFSSSPRPAGGSAPTASSGGSRATASSADADEVLKRLMEKREREAR